MAEQCMRTGCKEVAKWAPKINLPVKGVISDQGAPITGILGLKLCDEHIGSIYLKDLPGIEDLVANLVKGMTVDWNRVYFSRVDLTSEEFKAWEK